MCTLKINKHEDIRVCLYWNDVGVPDWRLSAWSNGVQCVTGEETEDTVKTGDISIYVFY